ncbi:MHS family MFS transporter [Rhodococcus pyridinivorans]|uniref:MFS transporter n=1 Tax=Rhodococcus pyridinivorans TaxID=103816 RepID=UPI001E3FF9BE|nr:MFS transporter [Rhodococcus pyridinivorans]MCD5422457.1 MHS family MFS transporter [Rhodococcus pyridinivorans]
MSNQSAEQVRRAALSGFVGTWIEYFDFYIYGTLAALLFNEIFFDNLPPLIGTIAALATLAVGYLARFAGGAIFGHFGDRIGRKSVLLITLVMMGLSSGLIGILPTQTQIGLAAPLLLLLLRLIQGIAVGGEYGGAVLMTAEHASDRRRGLTTSLTLLGAPLGSLSATAAALILTSTLTEEQLMSWGWRLPFLSSFILLAVGIYIRARLEESPVFEAQEKASVDVPRKLPVVELFRKHGRSLYAGIGLQIGGLTAQGIFAVFILSHLPTLGYTRSQVLTGVLVGTVLVTLSTPLWGLLSDRFGRKAICMFGSVSSLVLAFPMFWVVNLESPGLLIAACMVYFPLCMATITSVSPTLLSELFPTEMRYTGVSLSYQLAATIGPGLGPVIAASLVAATGGNNYTVAGLLAVAGIISIVSLRFVPETRGSSLDSMKNTAEPAAGLESPGPEVSVAP